MGNCEYCGTPAGFLKKYHKYCKEKFESGRNQILSLIKSSISKQLPLDELEKELRTILKSHIIKKDHARSILIAGWEAAVEKALEDSLLTKDEESFLVTLSKRFALSQDEMDKNGVYSKVVKGAILRDVLEGRIPERVKIGGNVPFNLQKTEKIIWLFQNVACYEQKTRREYVGGYQGVSIRIAKGLYYRTGGFKGQPVDRTETVHIDTGLLGVTNKHIYFAGDRKNFRIRYDKIVSFIPYSDGVGIQEDKVTAKPKSFITDDGWFTYNLLLNVSKL
jgi:hypothetical protein